MQPLRSPTAPNLPRAPATAAPAIRCAAGKWPLSDGGRNLTAGSAMPHHYPTGTANIVAGTMTFILINEWTTNSLDECDLSLLDIAARGRSLRPQVDGVALHVERKVSGPARRALPTLCPGGSRTQHAHLPPFDARASTFASCALLTSADPLVAQLVCATIFEQASDQWVVQQLLFELHILLHRLFVSGGRREQCARCARASPQPPSSGSEQLWRD